MVIRIPGLRPGYDNPYNANVRPASASAPASAPAATGPQPGPDPVWARFTRNLAPDHRPGDPASSISVRAFKPDPAAYRILGREPNTTGKKSITHAPGGALERNRHNSSVYIASVGRFRGLPASRAARLPVAGEIAAGQYDVSVAFQEYDCLDYEGGVAVDKALARGGAYALRVRGTSMTHVGIEPGDVVVVRPQDWAEDGDFVVASYTGGAAGGSEGLATLKRFYRRKDHIFLQSATSATDPILLFPVGGQDTVQVQGVVTMILKAN